MTSEQIATTKPKQDLPVPQSRDDDSTEAPEVEDASLVNLETDSVPIAEDVTEADGDGDEGADDLTEIDGGDVTEPAESGGTTAPGHKWARTGIAVLAVLLLAAAGLTAWLYLNTYRPAQGTDSAATQSALDAAKAGTVAALSYSPDSLDKDLDTAKSHLTGEFLNYYTKFTDEVVRPAVKQKKVSTAANVVRAAVSEMHPDHATVLVFVNQQTTSADRTEPSMMASSVLVTVTKTDGKWLISEFNPI